MKGKKKEQYRFNTISSPGIHRVFIEVRLYFRQPSCIQPCWADSAVFWTNSYRKITWVVPKWGSELGLTWVRGERLNLWDWMSRECWECHWTHHFSDNSVVSDCFSFSLFKVFLKINDLWRSFRLYYMHQVLDIYFCFFFLADIYI